jgi:hypothetical protein
VNSPFPLGFQMAVRPTVSADRRFVRCELSAEYSDLASANVPMFPTTTFVTPVFEGGAQGQPIPFTQFIQQPGIVKRGVSKSLAIPDGGTAVLYAGKCIKEDDVAIADDATAPFFDWIYDFVDLFHTPEPVPTFEEHLFVLVTPRVIRAEEMEFRAAAQPMPIGPVAASPCPPPPTVRQCAAMADAEVCPPPIASCCTAPRQCTVAPCPTQQVAVPQQQVQLDVCVLCMDPSVWVSPAAASWADLSPNAGEGKKLLSPEEAGRFCQSMKSLGLAKIIAEPRLVTMCGRPATFLSGGQQMCAHDFILTSSGNKLISQTVPEVIPFGTNVTFLADAVADGFYLQCECGLSTIRPAKQYQITIQGEGEEPRTEKIQFASGACGTTKRVAAAVPTGRTLFFHCGRDADGRDVILTVTPHVINAAPDACMLPPPMSSSFDSVYRFTPIAAPIEPAPAAPPAPMPAVPCVATVPAPAYEPQLTTGQFATPGELSPLDRMMAMYRQACAAGDKVKAQAYADCCLAIDPTCFGK